MAIKKGTAPKTIDAKLTISSLGQTLTQDLTYFNRSDDEIKAKLEGNATVTEMVLFLVKEWDSDFPLTQEGLEEMEKERRGVLLNIWQGFNQARESNLVKN